MQKPTGEVQERMGSKILETIGGLLEKASE